MVDPGVVLLAGGVGSNPDLLDMVEQRLTELAPYPPTVLPAALGERASLVGAIRLAMQETRPRLLRPCRTRQADESGAKRAQAHRPLTPKRADRGTRDGVGAPIRAFGDVAWASDGAAVRAAPPASASEPSRR